MISIEVHSELGHFGRQPSLPSQVSLNHIHVEKAHWWRNYIYVYSRCINARRKYFRLPGLAFVIFHPTLPAPTLYNGLVHLICGGVMLCRRFYTLTDDVEWVKKKKNWKYIELKGAYALLFYFLFSFLLELSTNLCVCVCVYMCICVRVAARISVPVAQRLKKAQTQVLSPPSIFLFTAAPTHHPHSNSLTHLPRFRISRPVSTAPYRFFGRRKCHDSLPPSLRAVLHVFLHYVWRIWVPRESVILYFYSFLKGRSSFVALCSVINFSYRLPPRTNPLYFRAATRCFLSLLS